MLNVAEILDAKILIVDDQEANISMLEQLLSAAGYTQVSSTMNPLEVCALYSKHRYDLILLDLQMPLMDGFQVMAGLTAIETSGYIPVLVLTAQPGHKLRALQAGAKDFVSKPFDLIEVKARIHNLLEVRLLYQQVEHHNQVLEQIVQERTAELRESEERFHRFAELASDWYWEQDASGRFTQLSGPAIEMLGIGGGDGSAAIAANNSQGSHWNETERNTLTANIAARRPFLDLSYSRTDAHGSKQFFQMSGEPIFDPSGGYTGYRGIGMDVTARVSSELSRV
ncbi:MAG: response regulator [Candidatus Obscuribacterales bacterium]|nr:response regulator [Steroidobacteraceae bacterium]